VRGEALDLSKDPLAENRARIQMKDAPCWGREGSGDPR